MKYYFVSGKNIYLCKSNEDHCRNKAYPYAKLLKCVSNWLRTIQ